MEVYGIKTSIVCGLIVLLLYVYYKLRVKPEIVRAKLRKQGISGPLPSIALGNVPEIKRAMRETSSKDVKEKNFQLVDHSLSLFPYFKKWTKQFGNINLFIICFFSYPPTLTMLFFFSFHFLIILFVNHFLITS